MLLTSKTVHHRELLHTGTKAVEIKFNIAGLRGVTRELQLDWQVFVLFRSYRLIFLVALDGEMGRINLINK